MLLWSKIEEINCHHKLCSNLPEFERKSQGLVRGDAKKYALEVASDFMARFGFPSNFVEMEESDVKFREVCIWFQFNPRSHLGFYSKYIIGSRTQQAGTEEN